MKQTESECIHGVTRGMPVFNELRIGCGQNILVRSDT